MMPESEWTHVQRVMARLRVNTVVISSPYNTEERIYVNGELVYTGPDSMESQSYWGNQPFILCNTDGESDWECTSRNGTYLEKDVITEELI